MGPLPPFFPFLVKNPPSKLSEARVRDPTADIFGELLSCGLGKYCPVPLCFQLNGLSSSGLVIPRALLWVEALPSSMSALLVITICFHIGFCWHWVKKGLKIPITLLETPFISQGNIRRVGWEPPLPEGKEGGLMDLPHLLL